MCLSKNNFFKIKKYYFNIFLNKNTLKNNYYDTLKHPVKNHYHHLIMKESFQSIIR